VQITSEKRQVREEMRVVTLNCNGIRAASRKGFFDWLPTVDADIVCLQETKAQVDQLTDPQFNPEGYFCYYFDAEKKGYSGTALYSRVEPDKIHRGIGLDIADTEGRYLQADFGDLSVISLYLPSGSSGDERQARKMRFLDYFMRHMRTLAQDDRRYIVCGDWNICHKEIDIKNWKGNMKNSGFLPEERAWLDELFDEVGFADSFRRVNAEAEQYSWWSNRGQARANNVGWRLDYHVVSPEIADLTVGASIYREQSFSDHAPVIIDYELKGF
jgi:exodeoxyribonuclease-3